MDIAQTIGAAFDVWFEAIAGAVVTLVALVLFFNFRRVELIGRPESFAKNVFLQFEEQCNTAN